MYGTLPETNIFAPENGGPFEKEIPIGNHHFQGAKMLVSGSVYLKFYLHVPYKINQMYISIQG